ARWVYHTYFTAYSLFFRLACFFSGIQEPKGIFEFDLDDNDDENNQRNAIFPKQKDITIQNKRFNTIMGWFYRVMESNPQDVPPPARPGKKDPVLQLLQIREHILVQGSCPEESKRWIITHIPNIQSLLNKMQPVSPSPQATKQKKKDKKGASDTLETLAL